MSIEFACPSCGQQYSVKDEFLGRTTQCRKCNSPVKVEPATPPASDLASLLDDELVPEPPTAPPTPTGSAVCPACHAALASGASICGQCGHSLHPAKLPVRQFGAKSYGKPPQSAKVQWSNPLSGAMPLARGVLFAGMASLLGAVTWAAVAIALHLQIGWLAWGLGAAAGGGMKLGCGDKREGAVPGILAALIALGGIMLGKVFIVVWFVAAMIAEEPPAIDLQRELVASRIASEALEKRGIKNPSDEQFEKEHEAALATLSGLSEEQIDARFNALFAENAAKENAAQPPAAQAGEPAIQFEAPAEPAPSLIGAFFSTMFSPVDAIFIVLAFITAFKVGSGASTE